MLTKQVRRGTHRGATLEASLERARRVCKPLGITRVANVTGLDCVGIPVVTVCRPNARSLAVSQGKGLCLAAAEVSGLMESIELYHAETIQRPLLLASWNEVRFSRHAADITRLPRVVASNFHPDRPMLWLEGKEATSEAPVLVPFELVHANFMLPLPTGSGAFVMSSNGLASGNDMPEAILHALCEVIERDAVALFRCHAPSRQRALMLDLKTIDDLDCLELVRKFDQAGIAVGLWDITSDIGVPAFRCVVQERDAGALRQVGPVRGMGCHPAREVAMLRALTEAAQGRLTLISGTRDDIGREQHADVRSVERLKLGQEWLSLRGQHDLASVPTARHDTTAEDLAWLLSRLQQVGLEQVITLDLTRREFGISVVRVLVPGLEPHHQDVDCIVGARARHALAEREKCLA